MRFYANRPLTKARADPVFFALQARSYHRLGLDVDVVAPNWRVSGELPKHEIHRYFDLPLEVRVRHLGPSAHEDTSAKWLRASLLSLALLSGRGEPSLMHHHKDPWVAFLSSRRAGVHVLEVVGEPTTAAETHAMRAVDGVIAITPALAERLVERDPRLAGRAIGLRGTFDPEVAPWGRVDKTAARRHYGIAPGARVVAYSGKVSPKSNELPLIAAAASGLGVTLLVAGGTPAAQEWLASHIPDDVTLMTIDYMPPSDLARFYAAADVLVSYYPSDHPTLASIDPGKIYPYLGSGRPVVAARHASLLDLLEHQRNAELAAPDDADALRASLRRVLDDPAYAARLSEFGATTAAEYTIDHRAERIVAFANELLVRRPHSGATSS